ncbi:hypothetical protein Tco_0328831 [Tanacetum coccineum]
MHFGGDNRFSLLLGASEAVPTRLPIQKPLEIESEYEEYVDGPSDGSVLEAQHFASLGDEEGCRFVVQMVLLK